MKTFLLTLLTATVGLLSLQNGNQTVSSAKLIIVH